MDSSDWREAASWMALSELTHRHRASGFPLASNGEIEAALKRTKDGVLPPLYTLWLADNFSAAGQFASAARRYGALANNHGALTFAGSGLGAHALRAQSHCYERGGSLTSSAKSIQQLLDRFAEKESAADWHRLGVLAELRGEKEHAGAMFKKAADAGPGQLHGGTNVVELARRDLERMTSSHNWCRRSVERLADELRKALDKKDGKALAALASPTHFSVGVIGSERRFSATDSAIQQLLRDLAASGTLNMPEALMGSGRKRYLLSNGWQGEIFIGAVAFILSACPYGVEWSGIAVTVVPQAWLDREQPEQKPKKRGARPGRLPRDDYYPDWDPPPKKGGGGTAPQPPAPPPAPTPTKSVFALGLKSPWPAGMNLIGGGILPFSAASLKILSLAIGAGPLFWPTLAALTLAEAATRPCGFGFGGLYYGWPPTHVGADFFAVDFSRFLPFSPGIPLTYGTPVLAVASGIVLFLADTAPTGSESFANEVHIGHFATEADAFGAFLKVLFTGAPMDMYVSEYLHMDGPKRIPASLGMFVRQGARLGVMDDTGFSALHHLHFSLHDTAIKEPTNHRWGMSVPPIPMDSQPVFDGECMFSTNMPIP